MFFVKLYLPDFQPVVCVHQVHNLVACPASPLDVAHCHRIKFLVLLLETHHVIY